MGEQDVISRSYDPDRISAGGRTAELERLEGQAAVSFEEELRIFDEIGLTTGGTLLEVGCGSGAVTRRLRAARPGTRIVAIDADLSLLALAGDADVELIGADAAALPVATGSADGALLRYVVQHLVDPQRVLTEIRRALRPGGVIAVVDTDAGMWGLTEPHFPDLVRIGTMMAQAQRDVGGNRLVGRRLTRLLRSAGFVDVGLRIFAVTSDNRPVDDFAPLLGPQRLAALIGTAGLTLRDLAVATDWWHRFRRNPDAWVMLLGYIAFGRAPGPAPLGGMSPTT